MTDPTPATNRPDPHSLSYEQARDALAHVVQQLETGGATLEQSLALWEYGEALVARCQQWLDDAQARIERAQQNQPTVPSSAATEDPAAADDGVDER